MTKIRELFDQDINRRIEKVIQYQTTESELLKQEIQEYIATDSIQDNMHRLLDLIDEGMQNPSEREVGVWVSGFYGSGKSSFTKYLGYALDSSFNIDGTIFRELLKNRLKSLRLQQRLETVATRHDPAVILVDLSVDAAAQSHAAPISTVLFLRVLEWAGYSRYPKHAYLELLVDQEGRRDELEAASKEMGKEWKEVHNNPILGGGIASRIATSLYPKIFPDQETFENLKIDEAISQKHQIEQMLGLVEQRTGKQNVVFVLDEVGQHIAAGDYLISNLQGLAQTIKALGKGRVWILATAQQTLTDDVGAINSPKLFKLKDRFPIPVELKADDIKTITHERLLSKKPTGAEALKRLYSQNAASLNVLTKLEKTKASSDGLSEEQFLSLYPFLPQQFDLMMRIIARLARSTGGTGLRSAIKVVQETLIASRDGDAFANRSIGDLVTVVDFYDVLREDLESSPSVRHTVDATKKTIAAFGASSVEAKVAKAVAVVQILEDFPLTRKNLASLLVDTVDAKDYTSQIEKAVETLLKDPGIPLVESEESLRFLSDRAADLERAWKDIQPSSAEQRQVLSDAILESVLPTPPKATIFGTKQVGAAVALGFSGQTTTVSPGADGIVAELRLVGGEDFQSSRTETLNASNDPANAGRIVVLAAVSGETLNDIRDAHASDRMSKELVSKARDADEEAFYRSLSARSRNAKERVAKALKEGIDNGTVIYLGNDVAVKDKGYDSILKTAVEEVGKKTYEKYAHASVTVSASAAEKILKSKSGASLTSSDDPLGLLTASGGAGFNASHAAVLDVKDYLNSAGQVLGKRLLDEFSSAPYGWNKDVTRYVLACMFVGGHLTVRLGAKAYTTVSQPVVDGFKTNAAFGKIGIDAPPQPLDPAIVKKAKDGVVLLTGQSFNPIPANVEMYAREAIMELMSQARDVIADFKRIAPGAVDYAREIQDELQQLSLADQNALVKAFGGAGSTLPDRLDVFKKLHVFLTGDFRARLEEGRRLLGSFEQMPPIGAFGALQADTEGERSELTELYGDQHIHLRQPRMQELITDLTARTEAALQEEYKQLAASVFEKTKAIRNRPKWALIPEEFREQVGAQLDHAETVVEDASKEMMKGPDAIPKFFNTTYTVEHILKTAEESLSTEARKQQKSTPSKVMYVTVPSRDLEVAEAKRVIEGMKSQVENAPDAERVRFQPEG